jgi:hypothetical protein
MFMKNLNYSTITLSGLVLLTALYRIVPFHPANFTPVTAIALLGSAYFTRKWMAFVIPFAIMFLSDLVIGLHNEMPGVYISYAMIIGLGFMLRSKVKPLTVIAASLASSVIFFVVTNFYVWFHSPYYTQDMAGLMICYYGALEFFRNSILADLIFTIIFFAGFEYARFKFPKLKKA